MTVTTHRFAFLFAAGLLLVVAACGGHPEVIATEVVAVHATRLPDTPEDPAWRAASVYRADLLTQDLVEPRLLEPSTAAVRVRALTDGVRIAFLLEWDDATFDETPRSASFSDACAVQFPLAPGADVPDPQMGNPGRAVEITLWRASWQAWVDGRQDDIRSIYPNAAIDHYPFEAASLEPGSDAQREAAERYAPARRLGNAMEGPRERPVEDLLAEGPGTLSPASQQRSAGRGVRTATGWRVMIVRPLPELPAAGGRGEIAVAVWDGAREEVGARKMRSVWIPLAVEDGA